MTVVFDGGMLKGVRFTWTFDDMFSNMILSDYDPKHTGHFDAAQVKAVKEGAFDNLENYHYFVAFAVGKKQLSHFKIEQFTPSVTEGNKLVYSFFVPLNVPVQANEQSVRITVYDDSYYVAFDLLHLTDVTVQAGEDVAIRALHREDEGKAALAGPVHARSTRHQVQRKLMKRHALALVLLFSAMSCFGQVGSNPFTARDSRPRPEGFLHETDLRV